MREFNEKSLKKKYMYLDKKVPALVSVSLVEQKVIQNVNIPRPMATYIRLGSETTAWQ